MKPALILLHGALGGKDQFSTLQENLKDQFQIYTLNFEGHGGRKSDREYSMENFEENLLDLIETENLEPANIFGYSMGGYVALKLAIDYPAKVQKIMTLGTKFAWTPESANDEVSRLNPLKIEEKVPEFARQLKERHSPLDWRQVLSKTGEMILTLGKGAALVPKDFEEVQCPVLITRGSEDQMVSEMESRKIAETLPQGEYHSFEGFKHPLEQADTDTLANRIIGFFKRED